jgi:uncharacterized membrane protein YfcA
MEIWLSLCGLFVGMMVGLTGMGGGLIMTPLLILFFGVQPAVAVGTDLIFASVTKIFGAWGHWRQKTIDFQLLKYVAVGSIPGTMLGILLLKSMINGNEAYLQWFISNALGVLFFCISFVMILQLFGRRTKGNVQENKGMNLWIISLIGFLIGLLVALTSVGSGTLFVALLLLIYPFSASRLVGTDIIHGLIITGLAGTAHIFLGTIDFNLVFHLLIGSIPGVIFGSRITRKVPENMIRLVLAVVLVISAIMLMH